MPTSSSSGGALARAALEHLATLHRLARHLTGDAAEAEDLVQEAYARALGAESQFAAGTNMRAWLCRIVRNAYIDTYRRAAVSPVRGGFDECDDGQEGTQEPLRGDEELERLRCVVGQEIEAALLSLPVDARTVILLDSEGFTETQLAEVLGCAIGTVKSRLARGRAALRRRLSDYAR